jgi:preprotein translocase subunit SecA
MASRRLACRRPDAWHATPQVPDLYDPRSQWASYLVNALKAKELQIRDVNYIVRGDEVIIVDEFTGRTMPGRRWGDGLHQAVEAKEKLTIQNETITLASISYQVPEGLTPPPNVC